MVFVKWLSYGGALSAASVALRVIQAEPSIPVAWAVLISVAFSILLVVIAMISPIVNNRSLILSNRENREISRERINGLETRVQRLEAMNQQLAEQNIELRTRNGELEVLIKGARDHIVSLEERLWALTDGGKNEGFGS